MVDLAGIKNIYAGLLTGCGQKWGIVRHCEGQLCGTVKVNCAAKTTNCAANCVAVNSSFQMFGGGAK